MTVVATRIWTSPAAKPAHDLFLLGGLHPPVQEPDTELGEDLGAEALVHLGRVAQVELLRLLDERVDDVGLAARADLARR